ncbi:helix-turn-helix domain-containing protein [Bradyrhizobium brasilense]|uniref:Helix-turn-helix transcriptional regulator n=1 Tax=Bradyrhizobium brasilense TaxID=1419277 RepID=A0ABY8JK26_9BRAD|nr:helix-turn-helix transcriptional regulator [Bradyrhizobium brasilense]WFU65811.1 helix-turn-helix transcriptional regulator [Bradyrhizobium brasilense]
MANEPIYKTFGKALAARRRTLGWTQSDLAGRVGMSRASIANIENGRQSVLLHYVYALASALECSKVADLLPAPPRTLNQEDSDMLILSDEDVTPIGKSQIRNLIENALAQRGSKKAGS